MLSRIHGGELQPPVRRALPGFKSPLGKLWIVSLTGRLRPRTRLHPISDLLSSQNRKTE